MRRFFSFVILTPFILQATLVAQPNRPAPHASNAPGTIEVRVQRLPEEYEEANYNNNVSPPQAQGDYRQNINTNGRSINTHPRLNTNANVQPNDRQDEYQDEEDDYDDEEKDNSKTSYPNQQSMRDNNSRPLNSSMKSYDQSSEFNRSENIRPGHPVEGAEQTLSIIKPDAVRNHHIGAIISRFEDAGLRVAAIKMIRLNKDQAAQFYGIHRERPFFRNLVDFMSSGPVVVMVLEGNQAISKNRQLMGATDPRKAEKGTIRSDFAESVSQNAVHGSDSPEAAREEILFFFKPSDIQRSE